MDDDQPITAPRVEGADLPLKMPVYSFDELELPDGIRANVGERAKTTLLESYAAPIVLAGRGVALVGASPHGDDQVLPFMLGLVGRLLMDKPQSPTGNAGCQPRALLLAPTRTLCRYAAHIARDLARGTSLRCAQACGGVPIETSAAEIEHGVDLLAATPGRLLDVIDRGTIALGNVRMLCLVGVDALFDSGYDAHLKRVVLDEGMPLPQASAPCPPTETRVPLSCAWPRAAERALLDATMHTNTHTARADSEPSSSLALCRFVPLSLSCVSAQERQTLLSCATLSSAVLPVLSHLLRPSSVRLTVPKPWIAACTSALARQAVVYVEERTSQPLLASLLKEHGALGTPNGSDAPAIVQGTSAMVSGGGGGAVPAARPMDGPAGGGGAGGGLSLVIAASRRQCEILLYFLQGEGISAAAIGVAKGEKRTAKEATLASFAAGSVRVLIVTGATLEALGDELCPVGHVISFDFPPTMQAYASRLAQTARCGHTGRVSTFVTEATPREQLKALCEVLVATGNELPRWLEGMATAEWQGKGAERSSL